MDARSSAILVLSRKIGEKIHVGDSITVEVRRVAGNRVSLAIEAPRHVRVLRGELHQAGLEALGLNQIEGENDA